MEKMICFIKANVRYVPMISNARLICYTRNLQQNTELATELHETDMPVEIENPFKKEKLRCILCKLEITPKYTNPRLLSQFISRFTGKMYGRHITGLCRKQHDHLEMEIQKSIRAGLLPAYFRDPRFAHDPQLYNPDNPFRPHRY